jgi:hypothetical protein
VSERAGASSAATSAHADPGRDGRTLLREADASATRPAARGALLVALLDEVETLLEAIERERAAAGMRIKELASRGRAGHAYGAGR